jgi:hypothetical protein
MMINLNKFSHLYYLLLGGFFGLVFAGYGIFNKIDASGSISRDAIAVVNKTPITMESYLRALDRYQNDSKDSLSDDDKSWVLQRLIEEELLVQRGFSLGMITTDNDVRGAIVRTLIASINAEAAAAKPHEENLLEFYNLNKERFTYPATISIKAWVTNSRETARIAQIKLEAGDTLESLKEIRSLSNIPNGLITLRKIREYLGPSIANAIMDSKNSNILNQFVQGRWYLIKIIEKNKGIIEPFESVKNHVENEFIRHKADQKLRKYINNLKESASITYLNQKT